MTSAGNAAPSLRSLRRSSCAAALATLLASALCSAEVVVDGSIPADGRSAGALSGPKFVIGAELGQLERNNLFHSFSSFNIPADATAEFTGPASVENVIVRVTGSARTSIHGSIDVRSSMPSANFFLLNPHGVLLGAGAQLNIGGSFYASTADYLRFTDGAKLYARLSQTSQLTVAAPAEFGFLGPAAASILVTGSKLTVGQGKALALIGTDIEVTDAKLTAPSGQIHLRGVASGDVPLLSEVTAGSAGNVSLARSTLDVNGAPAGTIVIRGGQLTIAGKSSLQATTSGGTQAAPTAIDLHASDRLALSEGTTLSSVTSRPVRGGDLRLSAGRTIDLDDATLASRTTGTGVGGDIALDAPSITVARGGIRSQKTSAGAGKGGNISFTADGPVTLMNSVDILSESRVDGGEIVVEAQSLRLASGASVRSESRGRGGPIRVIVEQLEIVEGARILSTGPGNGTAGSLTVRATESAKIAGLGSGLFTTSDRPGGNLQAEFGSLTLTREALIKVGSFSGGPGGTMTVSAGSISISDRAGIAREAFTDSIGPIGIIADTLLVDNGYISTSTKEVGRAGDIALQVGRLSLVNGGQIASSSLDPGSGAGGDIGILATRSVDISGRAPTGVSPIPSLFALSDPSSGIYSSTSSRNLKAPPAGSIHLVAPELTLGDGGKLSVATTGPGAAGNIALRVDRLSMTGASSISSTTGNLQGGPSGAGGDIEIAARSIELRGGSRLTASSLGGAEAVAGDIGVVFADTLRMDGSAIATSARLADGGNITITSTGSTLTLTNSQITTSVQSGSGSGGNITLGSNAHPLGIAVIANSQVLASAIGGDGGDISIFADIYLASGSLVDASSDERTPGTINVDARITDLSGSVAELPDNVLQGASLLRAACAARVTEGRASSLVVAAREGVPPEPNGLLGSPLTVIGEGIAAAPDEAAVADPHARIAGLWPDTGCAR